MIVYQFTSGEVKYVVYSPKSFRENTKDRSEQHIDYYAKVIRLNEKNT